MGTEAGAEAEVRAHVYDVASSESGGAVLHINRFFKDAMGIGGVFHAAIQVYGNEEWSFGYCDYGSGVFSCPPCKNPMYTFRETIVLGKTRCSMLVVNRILRELSWEWSGRSYDLLSKNCNHFCDAFCEKLDVPKLPGWVNRFANAGDAAMEVAETTAVKFRQAKNEIVNAGRAVFSFFTGNAVSQSSATLQRRNPDGSSGIWFRNGSIGARPSSSGGFGILGDDDSLSDIEDDDDDDDDDDDEDFEEEQHRRRVPHLSQSRSIQSSTILQTSRMPTYQLG